MGAVWLTLQMSQAPKTTSGLGAHLPLRMGILWPPPVSARVAHRLAQLFSENLCQKQISAPVHGQLCLRPSAISCLHSQKKSFCKQVSLSENTCVPDVHSCMWTTAYPSAKLSEQGRQAIWSPNDSCKWYQHMQYSKTTDKTNSGFLQKEKPKNECPC